MTSLASWNDTPTLWIAAFPPRALATARQLPRWEEIEEKGRFHPTALAAVATFLARR